MRRAWMLVAFAACQQEPMPDPIASGVWRTTTTSLVQDGLPILDGAEIHIDDQLRAEVCIPGLGSPLRVALAGWERDAFDSYHLRITALDPALRSGLPLPTLQALGPLQLVLTGALEGAEYLVRFCDASDAELSCESDLGETFTSWQLQPDAKACGDLGCSLGTSLEHLELLQCVHRTIPDITTSTPLCVLLADTRPAVQQEIRDCVGVPTGLLPAEVDTSCEALGRLASLGSATCAAGYDPALCDLCNNLTQLPLGSLQRDLCNTLVSVVNDPIRVLEPACSALSRLEDFDLACCAP